jgi:hypothetical protein
MKSKKIIVPVCSVKHGIIAGVTFFEVTVLHGVVTSMRKKQKK